MLELVPTDRERALAGLEPSEGVDRPIDVAVPATFELATRQSGAEIGSDIRTQVEFLRTIRSGTHDLDTRRELEVPSAMRLVWGLVAATAIATSIVTVGGVFTVVAALGDGLDPNPYVALSLLLGGSVLCATVAKIVHGDGSNG